MEVAYVSFEKMGPAGPTIVHYSIFCDMPICACQLSWWSYACGRTSQLLQFKRTYIDQWDCCSPDLFLNPKYLPQYITVFGHWLRHSGFRNESGAHALDLVITQIYACPLKFKPCSNRKTMPHVQLQHEYQRAHAGPIACCRTKCLLGPPVQFKLTDYIMPQMHYRIMHANRRRCKIAPVILVLWYHLHSKEREAIALASYL